eukprot:7470401-Alexandrium_andersonii.AAC.1
MDHCSMCAVSAAYAAEAANTCACRTNTEQADPMYSRERARTIRVRQLHGGTAEMLMVSRHARHRPVFGNQ